METPAYPGVFLVATDSLITILDSYKYTHGLSKQ